MPAVCRKRLHGGGDGDRSHRASQARAGSVPGRLELAAYLPPMPRGEDGYGDPPPLHDAGAGRVAGASKGDRQPGNCTIGVSLRRWLAGVSSAVGSASGPIPTTVSTRRRRCLCGFDLFITALQSRLKRRLEIHRRLEIGFESRILAAARRLHGVAGHEDQATPINGEGLVEAQGDDGIQLLSQEKRCPLVQLVVPP